jgi:hypothetical protein
VVVVVVVVVECEDLAEDADEEVAESPADEGAVPLLDCTLIGSGGR